MIKGYTPPSYCEVLLDEISILKALDDPAFVEYVCKVIDEYIKRTGTRTFMISTPSKATFFKQAWNPSGMSNDLEVTPSQSPKKYFATDFIADDVPRQLNTDLVKEILSYKPKSVFEFGAGQGKNLALIAQFNPDVKCFGIELNPKTVAMGVVKGRPLAVGDESSLEMMPDGKEDVAFTCGCLDHIIDVDKIIAELQRIAKVVILYETQDIRSPYYYKHDFASFGFEKKPGYNYHSIDGDGAYYEMWTWKR